MTDWTPDITVIPPDRAILLDLLRLRKRYRIEGLAWQSAPVKISCEHPEVANLLLDEKKAALETAEFHAKGQFRRTESALIEGTDYLSSLREMLKRQQVSP